MSVSWPKSFRRLLPLRRRPFAESPRAKTVRLALEGLEERCVPSANTIAAAQDFSTTLPSEVSFLLDQSGNAWEYNASLGTTGANPNLVQISTPATGQWQSIAAAFGSDGNPVLFAINRADGSLWEHSLLFGDKNAQGATATDADADTNWREISSGDFVEISATVSVTSTGGNPTTINPVVFATTAGGGLWEHNIAFGDQNAQGGVTEAGLNLNWREISTGQFSHIAAAQVFLPTITQNANVAGVPANPLTLLPTEPIVFGVLGDGSLWEHNANLGATPATAQAEQVTDGAWSEISSGGFVDIAAVQNLTVTSGANPTLGPSGPVVYGLLANGNLWEHNAAVIPGAAEGVNNANWAMISSGAFSHISAALDIEPANGSTPLTVDPILFASIQGSGNLWEHNHLFDSTNGEFVNNANWALLATGNVGAFSAALHAVTTSGTTPTLTGGGDPALFAIPSDLNLWEHLFGTTPAASEGTTDVNWSMLTSGLSFALQPLAALAPSTTTGTPLITLNLPPLDINLLGLEVQTTGPIQVTVSALPGQGELLGNLLTDVAGLLNLKGVNSALNNVLASVVSLVNSASLSVSGANTTTGPLSTAAASTTPVLDLFIAPVHLNLLGALVDTSPIHLTITAHSGTGLVLGNVVADLANLFNPPLPNTLTLDVINSKLQQLLQELTTQLGTLGGTPTPTPQTLPPGSEQVVSLVVPPIDVNLLGLVLKTSQIQVNADAQTGNGDLLGNVLTTLLNTLGATPQNLSDLSANLNALLSKVVGVLNASALTLPPDALNTLSGVLQTLSLPNLVNASGTASTPILNLSIASTDGSTPPVNVNLLGLLVTTSNIQAQLIAQTGDGQILGNLLYNVANLLNPGGSLNLLTILNQLAL